MDNKTHSETTRLYYGLSLVEPGMKKPECVYWAKLYTTSRGYPIGWFSGSAINGWVTASPFDSSWKRVVYNGVNSPSEGDIVFWSEGRCTDGHVGVANRYCNPLLLRYSDQNGEGKGDKISPRWSGYRNVLGWFTRK